MVIPQEKKMQELYTKKLEELNKAYHKVKAAGDKMNQIESHLHKYGHHDVSKAVDKLSTALTEYRKTEERTEEIAKKLGIVFKPPH